MSTRDYHNNADQQAQQRNLASDQQQSELFKALLSQRMQGQQAQQSQAHQTAMQQQAYNLKQKGQDADAEKLQGMVDSGLVPDGGGAKIGDVSFSKGYDQAKLQREQSNLDQKNMTGAVSMYNHALPKVADKADAANKLMDQMNDPSNPLTAGVTKSLLIRLHGMNRYNQEEAGDMIKKTAQSYGANIGNIFGSDQNTLLDPTQVDGVRRVVAHAMDATKAEHDLIKNQAINTYRMTNTANPTSMDKLQGMSQPADKMFDDFNAKYTAPQQAARQSQAQQQQVAGTQPQGGIVGAAQTGLSRLGGLLGIGGGQPKPPQVTQTAPAPGGSFAGIVPQSLSSPAPAAMSPRDQLNALRQKQGPLPSAGGGN